MRMRVSAAGLLVMASAVLAQTASAPAVDKPDYSTPKGAVRAYARAVIAQDAAGVRKSLLIAPEEKATVEALLGATDGAAKLYRAVRAKFGEAGVAEMRKQGTMELKMTAWLDMLDTAGEKQAGDGVVIFMFPEGPDGRPRAGSLTVQSVGAEWKVSAASAFNLTDAATAKKLKDQIPDYLKFAAAYNDVAAEVDAGRHTTIQSVQGSLLPRLSAILSPKPATTPK